MAKFILRQKQGPLGHEHVVEVDFPFAVKCQHALQGLLGGDDGCFKQVATFLFFLKANDGILDFLHREQHGLPVDIHGFPDGRLGAFDTAEDTETLKDRPGKCGTDAVSRTARFPQL